eukprot:Protomagalhaensia_sp_Gyna_25__3547@NODE_318_length_3906_cov_24_675459_g248_i0_p1_GENE_NODE_318_length_3906_cov_24_675459_g248_i0NODE_318_length_3906_cov_24_675459_g248_i0_p1_ORF_typecomplete_len529_score59_52TauE/PF01925_19/1_2e21TauE/PF01925_19/7_7e20YukC/PF10140_9/0_48Pox_A14/PF05767_12/5e03Pox_A14/PF05767_12/3_9e02Pox_A14/PF05767_12/19Pox_A14/PF05767_12/1_8e02TraL/PF07178_11/15TraL/PF07178_11/2_3e02TraL/PF07178_11/1_7e03_NODE_318_length_3906_cov_24_675459_g248_i08032389
MEHMASLESFTPFFWGLSGLCLIAGVLASLSGTGGGSLFIPIFSLAFPNDVHRAVPLSKVAVFGVALGACVVNFAGVSGTQKTSSYINYELATLIQPATLLGCLFGVFLNLLLPSAAIVVALIGILSFVAYKTFCAAQDQRRLAAQATHFLENQTPSTVDDEQQLDQPPWSADPSPFQMLRHPDVSGPANLEPTESSPRMPVAPQPAPRMLPQRTEARLDQYLKPLYALPTWQSGKSMGKATNSHLCKPQSTTDGAEEQSDYTPLLESHRSTFTGRDPNTFAASSAHGRCREVIFLGVAWAVNALCLAAAGGPAALACGPISNRMWLYCLILFHLGFITWTGARLKRMKATSVTSRHQWWWVEERKMIWYCSLSCMAGIGAGLLGIGGGLIKGPLLISIGLLPINAVATSNYMILFTSSTNVLAFLLAGRLDWRHSSIFAVLTLTGGTLGATTLKRAFSQSQRQYLLTFILGCSIVLGGLAMAGVNIREMILRASGQTQNIHEKTFAEACEYLKNEPSLWRRLKLVDI